MFDLVCNPQRGIIGSEIDITFTINDEFNRKNYNGKYIYLAIRKNGSIEYFNTSVQRYNSNELFWTVSLHEYKINGTFLVEARVSPTATQSTNSKNISCNSFIIHKEASIKQIEENNISAIKNEQDKIKCFVKNVPNDALTETVRNKVTLNIKKDKVSNDDTNNTKNVVYSNVMISKKKYT
jgi:hypothetical protein